MTDLVLFAGLVTVILAVGVAVGMIVAGRIDRLLAPRPAKPAEPAPDLQEERP
jgi:hypothetical protein